MLQSRRQVAQFVAKQHKLKMPKGLPSAAQLWNGEVSFFSIDTNLIQQAGYNFEQGILNQIPKVSPETMGLLMPDIVMREIVKHLMKSVYSAAQSFESASSALKRSAGVDMTAIDSLFKGLSVEEFAASNFRMRVENYVKRTRGSILAIQGEDLAERIFQLYFSESPPFAERKEKKAEFPDAVCLMLLEDHARECGAMGILASDDGGWSDFAENSDHLYCVKTLDDLIALFRASGELAAAVTARVTAAIADVQSAVREALRDGLEQHVRASEWSVEDISSGYSGVRVEATFHEATMESYDLRPEATKVWNVPTDRAAWVIEVAALLKVDITIDATFYQWDSFDRDEFELTSQLVERAQEVEVKAFLTCTGPLEHEDPTNWEIDVEIADEEYDVDVGEVDPDMGGH
ncbi:PIN domain-containing protein [Paraburkholderia sp. BL25I1N1]|uniref:PIN domain-containing protein n=1 Tax=Paraburkholderia sp. BL25I1N1 TaxID=1938804 RepID=UPI000D084B84|nr:PIN domain-containing protein [Paraburkholderia sp. BL25I1N1]PRY09099.1 hypothetical protein B0G73_1015 [Paraburkholderia sp. BL25I1N1]